MLSRGKIRPRTKLNLTLESREGCSRNLSHDEKHVLASIHLLKSISDNKEIFFNQLRIRQKTSSVYRNPSSFSFPSPHAFFLMLSPSIETNPRKGNHISKEPAELTITSPLIGFKALLTFCNRRRRGFSECMKSWVIAECWVWLGEVSVCEVDKCGLINGFCL